MKKTLLLCALIAISTNLPAQEEDLSDLSPEERAFLEDDSFFKTLDVSQGILRWVEAEITEGQYHLSNVLTITKESMESGWLAFSQCHYELDEISKIEVVYNPGTTKQLSVTASEKIASLRVDLHSVELSNVEKGASVCISGLSKTFKQLDNNHYELTRGPYMRRFLDGYYPMHLKETIHWADTSLEIIGLPQTSTQLKVPKNNIRTLDSHSIQANYYFEGVLTTRYRFTQRPR